VEDQEERRTEGLERDAGSGAKRRSAERVRSGEIKGSGAMPPEKSAKINFEIAYFLQFCKLK